MPHPDIHDLQLPIDLTEELFAAATDKVGLALEFYARPHLHKSLLARMQHVGAADVAAYGGYLDRAPREYVALRRAILNPCTELWRERDCFAALRWQVVPRLLQNTPLRRVKVWSAACSTGEEPYSLAMLFAEAVGVDALRERVRIRATDVNRSALHRARLGCYPARKAVAVPQEVAARYLELDEHTLRVSSALRDCVTFSAQDLLRSAARERFDLITCLNTLIYFTPRGQRRVLASLYLSLAEEGLVLATPVNASVLCPELFWSPEANSGVCKRRPGRAHDAISILSASAPANTRGRRSVAQPTATGVLGAIGSLHLRG